MNKLEAAAELKALAARIPVLADILIAEIAAPAPVATGGTTGSDPGLADAAAFYNYLRADKMLGPKISATEYQGCKAILTAMHEAEWPISWAACGLSTSYLETAGTMQPIKEYGGPSYFRRMYDIEGERPAKAKELGNTVPGDGIMFAGRGYVQLTGRNNYARAAKELGLGLIGNPDLALQPDAAAAIMCRGMEEGWFTGKKLADYLPASGQATVKQFRESRRIINGLDRADDIADYAIRFQKALVAGGWL
jgi:putative chitinase